METQPHILHAEPCRMARRLRAWMHHDVVGYDKSTAQTDVLAHTFEQSYCSVKRSCVHGSFLLKSTHDPSTACGPGVCRAGQWLGARSNHTSLHWGIIRVCQERPFQILNWNVSGVSGNTLAFLREPILNTLAPHLQALTAFVPTGSSETGDGLTPRQPGSIDP